MFRRHMTSAFALGLLVAGLDAAPATADVGGQFAVRGGGLVTCEQYLKAVEGKSIDWAMLGGWIDGYLSATNQHLPETFDVAPWQTTEVLISLIKNNCEQEPKRPFFTVVAAMANGLREHRLTQPSTRATVRAGDKAMSIYETTLGQVQAALAKKGLYQGAADGHWSDATQAALTAFQKQQGFEASGLPDQRTLWALIGPSN